MKNYLTLIGLFFYLSPVVAAPTTDVLFVALGGYSSCNKTGPTSIGMYNNFQEFLTKVKQSRPDTNIRYLVACLGDVKPPKGQGQFITSENPDTIQHGDTTRVRDEIESLTKLSNDMKVFIVGHSYGGWMSMYLPSIISPTINIAGLFTLDPISYKCGKSQVVLGGSACKQAPKDLNNQEILQRVGLWENFYQNQDTWLHSSSIPEANNHLMKYRGPHNKVDRDPTVWNIITDDVVGKMRVTTSR